MRARDVMTSPVVTVTPQTPVKVAAMLLASHGFTALPVVDDDRLVGIVTEADLVRARYPHEVPVQGRGSEAGQAERGGTAEPVTVGEAMTTPAAAMSPNTAVTDLTTLMLDEHVRSIPIVEGSRLVGIVTRRDLVRTIARDDGAIAADIRYRLEVYGGRRHWSVTVRDGAVTIGDDFDDERDRNVVTALAEAVPGVTRVQVISRETEDDR